MQNYLKTASDSCYNRGMNCPVCKVECRNFGKHRNGLRRFRCTDCGKTYTEPHKKPFGDMKIPVDKAVFALTMILEGSSIRSTERVTGVHPRYHHAATAGSWRHLRARDVEVGPQRARYRSRGR